MPATEELRVIIRTVADATGAHEAQQSLTRIGVVAGVASTATNFLVDTLRQVPQVFGETVNAAREHERVIRATGMAYGQAAGQYVEFARQLEATTGFTSDAILQAALSARTLSQNYGLTIQQTQKLITVSADLARVRGIGIAEAFERVQSAIRGEAEASEYLGLTLNDTFLTNQAMNGSLKNTFGTMTDIEKAQVRYNELLRQSAQFTGLAARSSDSLDAAFNRAGTSAHNAALRIGELTSPATLEALRLLAQALDEIAKIGTNEADVAAGAFLQSLGTGLDKLRTATSGKSLADLRENSAGIAEAWNDISQAGTRANLATTVAVTKISDNLADLKDRYVDVDEQVRKTNAAMARVALIDQLRAATSELTEAYRQQNDIQRESVQLSAQLAAAQLALLPTTERLQDVQTSIQRNQILLRMRGQISPEARQAARMDIRNLTRNVLPGAELAALDADIATRSFQRTLARNQLLGTIAAGGVATAEGAVRHVIEGNVNVNITGDLANAVLGDQQKADVAKAIVDLFHNARVAAENTASNRLAGV